MISLRTHYKAMALIVTFGCAGHVQAGDQGATGKNNTGDAKGSNAAAWIGGTLLVGATTAATVGALKYFGLWPFDNKESCDYSRLYASISSDKDVRDAQSLKLELEIDKVGIEQKQILAWEARSTLYDKLAVACPAAEMDFGAENKKIAEITERILCLEKRRQKIEDNAKKIDDNINLYEAKKAQPMAIVEKQTT